MNSKKEQKTIGLQKNLSSKEQKYLKEKMLVKEKMSLSKLESKTQNLLVFTYKVTLMSMTTTVTGYRLENI